jgi:hypothetical protein
MTTWDQDVVETRAVAIALLAREKAVATSRWAQLAFRRAIAILQRAPPSSRETSRGYLSRVSRAVYALRRTGPLADHAYAFDAAIERATLLVEDAACV